MVRFRRVPDPSFWLRIRQSTALPDGTDPAAAGGPLAGGVVVGGAVRDVLLRRTPVDVDWLVADPEAAARVLAARVDGALVALDPERGHWRVVMGGATWDLSAPLRGELDADLRRRDVTVNALAWRPGTTELVDPTGGLADLRARRVHTVSDAALRDDPLRAWRVVRIAAQLGFRVTRRARAQVRDAASALAAGAWPWPAPERVGAELDAVVATAVAGRAVRALDDVGLLVLDLPELVAGRGVPQGPLHHLDVLDHQLEALQRLVDAFPEADLALRWATLLHDVGKPPTREPGSVTADALKLRDRFHGHDAVGARLAGAALERLRRPRARATRVAALVGAHMRPLPGDERAARRFVHRLRPLLPDLLRLMVADREAARGRAASAAGRHGYRERIGRVLAVLDEPPPAAPLLDGYDLMATLGLPPGPRVGELLAAVAEARAVGEVDDRDGALAYAERMARARGWLDAPP